LELVYCIRDFQKEIGIPIDDIQELVEEAISEIAWRHEGISTYITFRFSYDFDVLCLNLLSNNGGDA
jgi:hypothetical protein